MNSEIISINLNYTITVHTRVTAWMGTRACNVRQTGTSAGRLHARMEAPVSTASLPTTAPALKGSLVCFTKLFLIVVL